MHTAPTGPGEAPFPYAIRKPASDAELRDFLAPFPPAFGEEYPDAELEADRNTLELDRIVAAFDGDRSVGCAGAFSFRLTVPGGEVDAAGVTIVAVLPSHRRRGILRALMRQQLDEIRERGEPLAILWASEGAIYQRFGYGLASLQSSFDIEQSRSAYARPFELAGQVRLVTSEEAARVFPGLYEGVRRATPGFLTRSEAWWHWNVLRDSEYLRRGAGPKMLALHEVDGRPEGYAIYRLKPDWDSRGPKGELIVREVLATTARSELELWRWLLDTDLVARVRTMLSTPQHPLLLALAEPRRLGLTLGDGLWVRLVDLPAALGARSYAAAGRLVLEVRDSFCPWNEGRWVLKVDADGDGRFGATVVRTEEAPDLALDAADLGAVYLGGFRFDDLVRVGRTQEQRPGAVVHADRLFAVDRTPYCSTMF